MLRVVREAFELPDMAHAASLASAAHRAYAKHPDPSLIYPLISKVDSVLSIPMPSPSKTTRIAETGPITYRMDVLAAVADDFEGMLSDSHVSFNDPQAEIP
jgi:hypothetical protein